jgi:tetratricopeptide (TPR) repeat protein
MGGGAHTLQYAAPEQVAGLPVSIAADVWALGVLLYELLAERRPFECSSRSETESAILSTDPKSPSQCKTGPIAKLPKSLASDLDTIVLKALKRSINDRYSTVSALADDLDRWLNGEAVLAQPDSHWYRIRKFVGRHRLVVSAAALAMIAILTVASAAVWLGLQARGESERAVAARNFLIDMFRQADPDLSHGKDFTAKQLLDQGKTRILTALGSQPMLQSELLRGIADAQTNLGEYKQADATLSEVVNRYVQLHQNQQAGDSLVAQANVVFKAGDASRAAHLLEEAWGKITTEASAKDTLVLYYQTKSNIELSKGNTSVALEASRKSLELAANTFGANDIKTVNALVSVAKVELSNGHYSVASPLFDDAISRAQDNPLVHPRELLVLRSDRAMMHAGAGWFQRAAQQFAQIGDQCEQVLDRQGETCANFRRRESQMWLALGHNDRALKLLPAFTARMSNEESPQDQSDALMSACRILLFNGLQDTRPEWWSRLRALAEAGSEIKLAEQVKLWAMLLEAERLVRESRPALALSLLRQADDRNSQIKQQYSRRILFHTRLLQGLAQQQLGRHEEALQSMSESLALYPRQVASDHPRYLLASLYQARSLWATNQRDKALSLLDHALPKLGQSMGADAPIYLKAISLRNELATSAPRPETARQIDIFL